MQLQPKNSEKKKKLCVETIPYFSMFWDVRREPVSLPACLSVCITNTLAACRGRAGNAAHVTPGTKLWEMSV